MGEIQQIPFQKRKMQKDRAKQFDGMRNTRTMADVKNESDLLQ